MAHHHHRQSSSGDSYYAVGVGLCPGVYETWWDCNRAIGERSPRPDHPRPQWGKFDSRREAEEFVASFEEEDSSPPRESCRREDRLHRSRHGSEGSYGQTKADWSPKYPPERNAAPRSRSRSPQKPGRSSCSQIVKEHDYKQILARIERGGCRDASVGDYDMGRSPDMTFEFGFCVVHTHGAFFKTGPEEDSGRAAAGVWFKDSSALNITTGYAWDLRCSKNDSEIFAVVCALCRARRHGLRKVIIKSSSKYVVGRWEKRDWSGASNVLLEMLRSSIREGFITVRMEESGKSEYGAKEAKKLALASMKS